MILNGSCRHKHHVRCYVETYVLNPDKACRLCSSKIDPKLWDNPLDLKPVEETSPSLLSPFRAIASFVSEKLDNSIDNSMKSLLKQNLPIATLQRKGCTPQTLIEEMDTRLFSFLLNDTQYSTKNLKTLGFTWEHYLLGGFTSLHVGKARQRFEMGLFVDMIETLAHLNELCSNDVNIIMSLNLRPEEWKALCPPKLPPVAAMYQLGYRVPHLIETEFTLQEWHEIMGLDRMIMQQLYKFSIEQYLEFIRFDSTHAEEFAHRFKFNPYKNGFALNGRNTLLSNR